jgi:hypothetical protein
MSIGLLIAANRHGKLKYDHTRLEKYNFIEDLINTIIFLILYYFAGMFDWILK